MADFNREHKVVLDDLFSEYPHVRPGKMFGFPAYYVGRKLFACLYENGVGVKLPANYADSLLAEDPSVIPFQPFGRQKMRQWVQINLARSEDCPKYRAVFEEAIRNLLVD